MTPSHPSLLEKPWRRHGASLVFLFVVALLFFAPIHFSGKSLIAGDTVNWRGMAQSMIEYEQETGDAALWAGRAFSGMPGYMISPELSVPQVDDLLRWLRSWLWPTSHMFLLLAGAYWLGWYLTRTSVAGLLTSVAYGFTTYIPVILMAGHNSKFIALAWLPWMLLAFVHVMRRPGLLAALLFAVSVAVNLRAGHVQITYYGVIGALVWWAFGMAGTLRTDGLRKALAVTGWLALGSLLGLAMVAEPYLAHAEFAAHTIRGTASGGAPGGMGWDYAMEWSQGVGELITLLIADAYGGGGGTYWGAKIWTAGPHYFGSIVLVLAFVAFLFHRTRDVTAFLTAALIMTLFALGENLALLNRPMYAWFPLFSSFRVPETWLSVVALFVAMAGGVGLAGIMSSRVEWDKPWRHPALRVAGGALALVLVLTVFSDVFFRFERPNESGVILSQIQSQYPQVTGSEPQVAQVINQEIAKRKEARMEAFSTDARRTLIVLALFAIALFLVLRKTIPPWAFALTAVLLATFDLTGVGRRYINEEVLTNSRDVEAAVATYPFDEWLNGQRQAQGGYGHFRVLSLEFGQDPSVNGRPSFHHESLGGYTGAKLRNYQDFLDHVLFTSGRRGINARALDMMNVRYLVAERGLPGWSLAFQDDATGMSVFESPSPGQRAWFVDSTRTEARPEAIWSTLQSPDFNPRTEAIVATDLSRLDGPAGTATATLASWVQGQEMSFGLATDRPRLLVVSEVYYPDGWTARLDGQPVPIVQVNGLLRGIEVPAGSHELTMQFEPASFTRGRWITALSVMLTYGLLLVLGFVAVRRRKP
ncbi:MAG: hypothetical protein RIE53_00500 [Rhodothermales bacterium]